MEWKENGSGYIAKEGTWSAYIRQDSRTCMWRVFNSGIVEMAGFSDTVAGAKERIEQIVANHKG